MSSMANKPMSNMPRKITIPVLVVLIGFGLLLSSLLPVTYTRNIVNETITVYADSIVYFQFTVPSHASDLQVSVNFSVSGGLENDIRVYIMDSINFVNWVNKRGASAYYISQQVTANITNILLPSNGTYYLVFDNTSWHSPKSVNTQVTLTYKYPRFLTILRKSLFVSSLLKFPAGFL
jgi:hypothetical protein